MHPATLCLSGAMASVHQWKNEDGMAASILVKSWSTFGRQGGAVLSEGNFDIYYTSFLSLERPHCLIEMLHCHQYASFGKPALGLLSQQSLCHLPLLKAKTLLKHHGHRHLALIILCRPPVSPWVPIPGHFLSQMPTSSFSGSILLLLLPRPSLPVPSAHSEPSVDISPGVCTALSIHLWDSSLFPSIHEYSTCL